uniref:3-hydroxyisobutyryl-CoA hydrolase n=1 Tax=Quercus lobata TaxID=97700 RepID=A0A7N2LEH9_QUELO
MNVWGKGRAFCAGGDVAAVTRDINEGTWRLSAKFIWMQYTLNYILATNRKPQVSILNGIVMGGGAGASIHGRFRVATENSVSWITCILIVDLLQVFAMPETALGFFPDVGASYFLSRLPGFFGFNVYDLLILLQTSSISESIICACYHDIYGTSGQ